jgi:hypothetical protein
MKLTILIHVNEIVWFALFRPQAFCEQETFIILLHDNKLESDWYNGEYLVRLMFSSGFQSLEIDISK